MVIYIYIRIYIYIHHEWDFMKGPRSVSCDRAIRYSGFFGLRSVGPVGDFLEYSL